MKRLLPSYNHYTHHARRVLNHAERLVTRLRHPLLESGHLLIGVTQAHGSIGWQILQAMGLDEDVALGYLQSTSPRLKIPLIEMRYADEYHAALGYAGEEALLLPWLVPPARRLGANDQPTLSPARE